MKEPFNCKHPFDEILFFGFSASVDIRSLLGAWIMELLGVVLGTRSIISRENVLQLLSLTFPFTYTLNQINY